MNDKGRPVSTVGISPGYRINTMTTLGSLSLSGGLDFSPGFATVYLCDLGPHVFHQSKKLTEEDGLEVSPNTDIF